MAQNASGGGGAKIDRLRTGAIGIYRALDSGDGSVTRFAMVPYSHTVNVARSLMDRDILVDQTYVNGTWNYRICDTNGYQIWNCQNTSTTGTRPATGVQTISPSASPTALASSPRGARESSTFQLACRRADPSTTTTATAGRPEPT